MMFNCRGTETTGREQIKYRKDVEVTYILDRDLLDDPNADFSTLSLVSTLYNPERLPDGTDLFHIDLTLLHKIDEDTYQGYMPGGFIGRIFVQTENLAAKHHATVWIHRYGKIPTGENITIDGAYDIEVHTTYMRFKIK